ncbi:MAG: glycosyltransferase [Planctomycetota bacterium]|nr:MAG: glycosyltransferase [Planctomycetota bacterium]
MKICHIIPTLVQGGAEKQMVLLASHLNRQRFDPHVVVLTADGPLHNRLGDAGVPVHVIGKSWKFDPRTWRRLRAVLREISPDVVHTWLFAANSYGRTAARAAGVPVIVAGERCVDPWKRWWHFAIDRHLARHTDRIITNTSAVVDFYAQHGIAQEKFSVIPNAVEIPQVEAVGRAEIWRRLGLPPRAKLVLAVGRLWKQKGYKDLIWAADMLHSAFPDMWFVIAGAGPDLAVLQRFRDSIAAHDSVRFVGHRGDALTLLASCDALWNGSLYEGQSNTILEAMALGKPVLASDIPGNRDLVKHEETGFLYRLGDIQKLCSYTLRLLESPDLAQRMGEAAQARVRAEFSLPRMVAAHEALYADLVAARSRDPESPTDG